MKKPVLLLTLLLLIIGTVPAFAKTEKVTICHRPPGNVANGRTLQVGLTAVAAHLAHGDSVGECQPLPSVPELEVFGCDEWKNSVFEGQDVIFQHGIGFGTLEEALAEREGEEVIFELEGDVLGPVFYEGITLHSAPDFYGDRGRVLWTPIPGTFTVQSWWTHENEGFPGDVCTFTVNLL